MRSTGSAKGTHMYLALKDLHGPWRGDDPSWVHECQNGKIGRLGRPSWVGSLGDLVAPSLDSRPLISPSVPCLEIWLAVTVAAYCSPRGWSHGWSRKQRAVQRGGTWISAKSDYLRMSRRIKYENSMAFNPWSYATIIALPSLLGPLPHGDMAVPTWHTMAKTAKFGRNGPHS